MDYNALPHFCKREGSGSSRNRTNSTDDCYSLDHSFHQQLYNYIKQQAFSLEQVAPIKQGSFHVDYPEHDPEEKIIAQSIEAELQKLGNTDRIRRLLIQD